MNLTNIAIKNLKPKDKPYKKSDGGNLYLEVKPNGSKLWIVRYRFLNKPKTSSLGAYPLVSLREAREKRDIIMKQVLNGEDPSALKRQKKLQLTEDYENTFKQIALEWHAQNLHTWNTKHGQNIKIRLEKYVFPSLGRVPIKQMTAPELLVVISKVQGKGLGDLAHRLMQYCGRIIRYAVQTGRAENDFTHNLKNALAPLKPKHYDHLSEIEMPEFLRKLERYYKAN